MKQVQAVIVTGLCRSGGAAVADVLHHMGYPMGVKFYAPIPPTWRPDWEDYDLSWAMARTHDDYVENLTAVWWDNYLERRLVHSKAGGFGGLLGFKGPLLAVHGIGLSEALGRWGITWKGVWVYRKPEAVKASIDQYVEKGSMMARWNKAIGNDPPAWQPEGGWHHLLYEGLVQAPGRGVGLLARLLGVRDDEAVIRARSRVLRPTT